VAFVRTDVSEERNATSIIRVTRIGELGTTLAATDTTDDGVDIFLRNVGSYKSHTAYSPRRQHSSSLVLIKNIASVA
jgi:hypothetical protein